MVDNLWFTKHDEEAIRDLRDFIPIKIFDVHAHIYRQKDLNLSSPWIFSDCYDDADIAVWQKV